MGALIPGAVAAAGINAGANLIGGALSGKANAKAVKAQTQSANAALQFQREEAARAEQARKENDAFIREQWMAGAAQRELKNRMIQQNAKRLNLGTIATRSAATYNSPTPPPGWTPGAEKPRTLASLSGGYVPAEQPETVSGAPSLTLGDILSGSWSDRPGMFANSRRIV